MQKPDPNTTTPADPEYDRGLTNYERGIIHKSLGATADVECLDDDEAADYMRGYNEAWEIKL